MTINRNDSTSTSMKSRSGIKHFFLQVWRLLYYLKFVWDKLSNRWGTLDDPIRTDYYLQLWKDAAEKLSVQLQLLPEGFCEASFNGRSTKIYQNLLMLDHPVTMKLARSKPLVLKMLGERGISVPPYCEYSLRSINAAMEFLAGQHGAACVVKPAYGTAGGEGVTTNVRTRRDLFRASLFASLYGTSILIERQIAGLSYRLLFLHGTLLDAIRRKSPSIVGDGKSTVKALILNENRRRFSVADNARRFSADGIEEGPVQEQ